MDGIKFLGIIDETKMNELIRSISRGIEAKIKSSNEVYFSYRSAKGNPNGGIISVGQDGKYTIIDPHKSNIGLFLVDRIKKVLEEKKG